MAQQKTEQEKMEYFYEQMDKIRKKNQTNGVISMMQPKVVGCNAEEKTVTVEFQVMDWELNPQDIMHGGLVTTAVDTSFGITTQYYSKDRFITTVDIATSFLKPVPRNDAILVTVSLNSIGRTIISMTAKVHLKSNHLLAATATGTFMILNKKGPYELPPMEE